MFNLVKEIIMFSIIYTVLLNSLTRQAVKRPLGRWHASGDLNIKKHTRDWSSADNCGVCNNHNEPLRVKNIKARIIN
jgi:hypothetical protein